MTLARIEIRSGKSVAYRQSLIKGVRGAILGTLGIPETSLWIRVCERKEENFVVPPDRSYDALLIEVSLQPGRSSETKRTLYRTIVTMLADDPGVPPEDVCIVLYEPPPDNWSERSGKPGTDQAE
jgi:4-oxalocrotonate tautomerase